MHQVNLEPFSAMLVFLSDRTIYTLYIIHHTHCTPSNADLKSCFKSPSLFICQPLPNHTFQFVDNTEVINIASGIHLDKQKIKCAQMDINKHYVVRDGDVLTCLVEN